MRRVVFVAIAAVVFFCWERLRGRCDYRQERFEREENLGHSWYVWVPVCSVRVGGVHGDVMGWGGRGWKVAGVCASTAGFL